MNHMYILMRYRSSPVMYKSVNVLQPEESELIRTLKFS